ncbi:GNAT family N-acetyltransferase [Labedaea rhizosphaerae]|uniref:Ribosomal protein S18 acetylase RimI-like enzyme n=1 Tax=Labedaea rhizosphaerae TaxID=598644 RepID=A0A4R6RZA3_LABRH|nr:GNAT family N-acetyltransferase [Labedaea rhizosphaerae]TDP91927.1 ribosomal protein S18 acetylase RimI-like enzyme [Labedaea rhizosphaerae]
MTAEDPLAALTRRFTALDPLLPAAQDPPPGRLLTARLADGTRVRSVVTDTRTDPATAQALWSALRVWELHPVLPDGVASGPALHALIEKWRPLIRTTQEDSSATVTWPSRDVEATRVLLDHGFTPLCVLAVRGAMPIERVEAVDVDVRPATEDDLDDLVRLALAETAYSAQVGGTVVRPNAERIKRETIGTHLGQGDLVLVAERGGEAVGLAECWLNESVPGSWAETRLPHGRWGYVNCLSVAPGARDAGVGRTLMAAAHHELRIKGAERMFLYFNPPNPLSSVFWARQGYRPLWTIWEIRPAAALR